MATFEIKTRDFGVVRFNCRDEGGYVRIYGADLGSMDGRQPCEGGGFAGSTLMADEKTLEAKARRWWKQFMALERRYA